MFSLLVLSCRLPVARQWSLSAGRGEGRALATRLMSSSSSSSSRTDLVVNTSEDMKELGRRLGEALAEEPRLVLLRGAVGAGKTTLSRGIIQGWGGESREDVVSPSYLLDVTYDRVGPGGERERLHHVDLYRLKGDEDLTRLMGDEVFRDGGVWLVEVRAKCCSVVTTARRGVRVARSKPTNTLQSRRAVAGEARGGGHGG